MKLLIIIAAFVIGISTAFGRTEVPQAPTGRVIKPYHVEVTYTKTVHILFPAAVRYVDLGSSNLIAGKVEGAENVIRIKAAVRDFSGETNFSVITDDGVFYSFDATYSEDPANLNIEMEDWLNKDPYSDFSNDRMYIRLHELGNETPVVVNRIMYTIYKRNASDIKDIGCKKFGIQSLVKGIYIHNDLIFLHTSIKNTSNISFDIDNIRFRIADKKVAKRTAVQETFLEPVRIYNNIRTVDGKNTVRNVFTFPKFTIPDDKVLTVEIFERNGGRHQSYVIENVDLVNARPINELKIR